MMGQPFHLSLDTVKEMTGGMDEEQIFAINMFEYANNLFKRKEDVDPFN